MILFTILAIMICIMAGIIASILSIGGAIFLLIFGDIIICVGLIVFIVKCITKPKNTTTNKVKKES